MSFTNNHLMVTLVAFIFLLIGFLPDQTPIEKPHNHSGYMMKSSTAHTVLQEYNVPESCYNELHHYLQYGEVQFVRESCLRHLMLK